ncbi:hypothetical protein BDP81DRAFT_436363 [Colletotrichum phormii]|uniref:Nephrocystin 3-like N-terminal domain-containing protein n=1 Tax=Colletotrichum phormii TaxID=359342 RepID=A0AAI9ZJ49_9PEZI|nr:uncharacterized protein BDP81DRAFT_436363 [Colletotrichum phormii]KAK1625207.1 hypothetical protein BDP81DRAFT_436363 [Colletotrichum phormii]
MRRHLQASQSTMNTAVNVQVLEQCIASGQLSREIYDRLDAEERSFIANYEKRSEAIEDLIKQLHGHITKEHATTRETITNTIGMMETNDRQRQARENLLESLKYPRMNESKNTIHEKHDGTFEWVFEGLDSSEYSTSDSELHDHSDSETTSDTDDPECWLRRQRREKVAEARRNQTNADLLGWLQGDISGTFWISGKPGSGKSTFVKSIMPDKQTLISLSKWRSRPEIITHFFWKPGTLLQQNFQGLLRSFLHQVLRIDVDVCAQFLRKTPGLRRKHDETDWDMKELKRHLLLALHSSNRSYLIILDGLDEMAKTIPRTGRAFRLPGRIDERRAGKTLPFKSPRKNSLGQVLFLSTLTNARCELRKYLRFHYEFPQWHEP